MPSTSQVQWYGKQLTEQVRRDAVQRLTLACELTASQVRQNLSEGSPPHSIAGEFPHSDTGRLRNSITYEVDPAALTGRVGTNVEYAEYLEDGTAKMAARPFLERTLREMGPRLRTILGG